MGAVYENPYPQAAPTDTFQTALQKMAVLFGQYMSGAISPPSGGSGMVVPENDEQLFVYFGSTNNINTITYKQGGQVVAVQHFEYVGGVPVSNDANISRITMTPS